MVTCSRCGQSNEATSRFCVACGTRLATTQNDAQPSYAQPGYAPATGAPYAAPGAAPAGAPPYAPTQAVAYAAPPAPQPYAAQPAAAQPYGAQPYGAPPYAAQPAAPPSAAPYGVPSGVASPAAVASPGFVQPAPPLSGVPYEAPRSPFTQPSAGLPQGQSPASYGVQPPNFAAPAEPVRSKTSNAPGGARLEFAETAPPLLGEDVLSRKIQDRGAQRRAGSAAGSEEPPKAAPQPSIQREPLSVPSDAPRVLTGFLVSYEGSPLGQSWVVHQGTNLVGRSGAVAGADIELPHATVSSRHALLTACAHPGRITITDFASTNGSFVNDTALVAHEARELRDGDRIRFGLLTAIVKII